MSDNPILTDAVVKSLTAGVPVEVREIRSVDVQAEGNVTMVAIHGFDPDCAYLHLRGDCSAMYRAWAAASALECRNEEFRAALSRLLEAGDQLWAVEGDLCQAPGAAEAVVRFQPSQGLRDLLSAYGAGDV